MQCHCFLPTSQNVGSSSSRLPGESRTQTPSLPKVTRNSSVDEIGRHCRMNHANIVTLSYPYTQFPVTFTHLIWVPIIIHCNSGSYLASFSKYSEILVEKWKFFIPLSFDLHIHLEPLDFLSKILIQTTDFSHYINPLYVCMYVCVCM